MLDYNNSHNSFKTKQHLNNTVVIDSSYRSNSRKRGTGTQRISWGNHSVVANSEVVPLSQKKLMDMMSANQNAKKLESAYYPMKLKKHFAYDPNIISKLQHFPGVQAIVSKGKRHRAKSKGKSPHNLKVNHNLYVAYIKGNSRRVKASLKQNPFNSGNHGVIDRRVNTSLNPIGSIILFNLVMISLLIKILIYRSHP